LTFEQIAALGRLGSRVTGKITMSWARRIRDWWLIVLVREELRQLTTARRDC
jgi:hypothetical protein